MYFANFIPVCDLLIAHQSKTEAVGKGGVSLHPVSDLLIAHQSKTEAVGKGDVSLQIWRRSL